MTLAELIDIKAIVDNPPTDAQLHYLVRDMHIRMLLCENEDQRKLVSNAYTLYLRKFEQKIKEMFVHLFEQRLQIEHYRLLPEKEMEIKVDVVYGEWMLMDLTSFDNRYAHIEQYVDRIHNSQLEEIFNRALEKMERRVKVEEARYKNMMDIHTQENGCGCIWLLCILPPVGLLSQLFV